jgi:hypothetical protein
MPRNLTALLPPSLLILALACEHRVVEEAPTIVVEGHQTRPADDVVIMPSQGRLSEAEGIAFAEAPPQRRVVYLNADGATYTRGWNNSANDTSAIVSRTTSIPPYGGSADELAQLVQCLDEIFAPYDVDLTTQDPGDVPHIETALGGYGSALGYGSNIWGVAPLYGDCSTVERAVAFVFTDAIWSVRDQCETTAHEIGHALGLEHEFLCEDPMTYLSGCGDKAFQDADAWCGEYGSRSCTCGSRQNTHRFLLSRLGARVDEPPPAPPVEDDVTPQVALLSPDDGVELPGDGYVEVEATASDDIGLARVELLWHFNGVITMDCDDPPDVATCETDGDVRRWTIRVGTGPRSFSARAVDRAGNTTETETRTITLLGAEPEETGEPSVEVTTPATGMVTAPGALVDISVLASDDGTIADVDLWWIYPSGTYFHYQLSPRDGDAWGIRLTLSPRASAGERRLRVAVTDDQGNRTVHPDVVIEVVR